MSKVNAYDMRSLSSSDEFEIVKISVFNRFIRVEYESGKSTDYVREQ